jgi:hypothetical protein
MSFFSAFQNDPFFTGIDLPRIPALEHRSRHENHNRQEINDQMLDVFSNPFVLMQNMVNNMGQMMSQMETRMNSNDFIGQNGDGVSFSSSTIMSMDRRNEEQQPRIIQATSEKLRGPEGLERTRKAVRDTGRNLEKMEIAHRLGGRGHRIMKERDPSTGQLLENREFDHIENEHEFEREWFTRAEKYGLKNSHGNSFDAHTQNLLMTPRLRSQSQEPRHLAIEQTPTYNSYGERRKN